LAFLAGFFDAEGTIRLHEKSRAYAPEIYITNTDLDLLRLTARRLFDFGVVSKIDFYEQNPMRLGYPSKGSIWRICVWRIESVRLLLRALVLRHAEKIWKAKLALQFVSPLNTRVNMELVQKWDDCAEQEEKDRIGFIEEAREALTRRARLNQ
jgi:hypothetical protein